MTRGFHLALLRSASRLAPRPRRADWLAEWRSELCYVPATCRTSFCLGAFRDALWLRRHSPPPATPHAAFLQSPWRCLAMLAILATLSLALAIHLPAARDLIFVPQYADAEHLVTIYSMPAGDYLRFAAGLPNRRFADAAFYRLWRYPVRGLRSPDGKMTVAMSSRNLFSLLQLPVKTTVEPGSNSLVLSQSAWRQYFNRDPHIVGRRFPLAGQCVQVTAVISDLSWRLSGRADAWLLVDDRQIAALPENPAGTVVSHATKTTGGLFVRNAEGGRDGFAYRPVAQYRPMAGTGLLFLLACLALPAVTSLSLGDYPPNHRAPSAVHRTRRWIFLAVKIALVLPIAIFGSLDLLALVAVQLQPHAMLVGTVVGLRWALVDQRRRCPICLRMLSNPTSIGQPSRTFLDWYGTELICAKGHGLLHVPGMSNSYSTQRWMHLDPSWSSLFS